jgi:hypothetical protein
VAYWHSCALGEDASVSFDQSAQRSISGAFSQKAYPDSLGAEFN